MTIAARIALLALAGTGLCSAQVLQETTQPFVASPGPSLAAAVQAAQTAIDTCKPLHADVAVSIVDSAGVLKVLMASDNTFPRGVTSSLKKAVTAKDFNLSTAELAKKAMADPALAARIKANDNYILGAGGIPLRVGDKVVGAIGVGGSRGRDPANPDPKALPRDEVCARAAVQKIQASLR